MQFSMNNLCRYFSLPVITDNYIRSGDKGIRTLDPLLARQVLSQLSYTPRCFFILFLPISRKWAQVDSNHRPHAYQACALTS